MSTLQFAVHLRKKGPNFEANDEFSKNALAELAEVDSYLTEKVATDFHPLKRYANEVAGGAEYTNYGNFDMRPSSMFKVLEGMIENLEGVEYVSININGEKRVRMA